MADQVEFCVTNMSQGSDEVYEQLTGRDDIELLQTGCNSHCELCACSLYALVNEEVVEADTPEELLEKINEELELNSIR
ncbi:DUF1450 domain-containing protein [Planomicrobium sp. YIM 101495]|nr:DUF1450 domain-containing protein [Planomicrobium sp. YIM 101495]MTD31868.1 DUF1450 domain-containing protein [Planomicrobium sp. YIM 101495]